MMQKRTIKKILDDEDTIDIAKTAEAVLQENKRKVTKVPSRINSLRAWNKFRKKKQDETLRRQKLAEVWNKYKGKL
jgi:hypothetical protein